MEWFLPEHGPYPMIDVVQVPDPAASRIFVGNRFGCNPFMSREWLEAFSDRFREPVYLRFLRDKKEVGFAGGLVIRPEVSFHLPLNFRKLHFFTGPLVPGGDPKTVHSCFLALKRFACSQNYWNIYLDCLDFPYELDISSLGYLPINRDEYIIDLHDDIDAILGRLDKNRRQILRKVEKRHLNVTERTGAGKFESLVSCLQSTRRKKKKIGLGNYPAYYISYMDDEVLKKLLESSIAKLYCIQSDETVLCSMLCLIYKKCSYALFGGTTKAGYELNANTLLFWETMKKMKETGAEYLNLGRIPRDDSAQGLIRFKTGIGAVKHICTGGTSDDMHGKVGKILMDLHRKLSWSHPVECGNR